MLCLVFISLVVQLHYVGRNEGNPEGLSSFLCAHADSIMNYFVKHAVENVGKTPFSGRLAVPMLLFCYVTGYL